MAQVPDRSGRRDALVRLDGLTGLSAASVGLGFRLYERSRRPEERPAAGRRRNFTVPADPRFPEMAVIHGNAPRMLVHAALQQLGGMGRFVARGDIVVIKPNM